MNKGTFGFPDRFRDESFHSFPKKKVGTESFFGFPSGNEDYDIILRVTSANQNKTLSLDTASENILIEWGDGERTIATSASASNFIHTYAFIGSYNVKLYGNIDKIKYIGFSNQNALKVTKSLSKFSSLEYFFCSDNGFLTGQFPDISLCFNLKEINTTSTSLSGTVPTFLHTPLLSTVRLAGMANLIGEMPSFIACPLLFIVRFNGTPLTGDVGNFENCPNLTSIDLGNMKLTSMSFNFNNNVNLNTFIINNNLITGTLSSFLLNTLLSNFHIQNNQFSGILPSFNSLTNLITFNCSNNSFSGDIPTFSGCTSLQNFYAGGNLNAWTGIVPYFPVSLKVLSLFVDTRGTSILTFPIDLFDNLTELAYISTNGVRVNSPKTIPNISNNTKLIQFQINYLPYLIVGDGFTNGSVNFNVSAGALNEFRCYRNNGISLDFTNLITKNSAGSYWATTDSGLDVVFPFGEKIKTTTIHWGGNGVSQANQDASFTSMFTYRNNFLNTISKSMTAVQTVAPSGTYQQPAGFTHNLTEGEIDTLSATWSVKEKIWVLVNCQNSSIDTTKRYKWTITTA